MPNDDHSVPPLRQQYEEEVRDLAAEAEAMRAAGKTPEEVARALHVRRRDLGAKYKSLTPPDVLDRIHKRNLAKYGGELGPSIEWLRSRGKTWEQIIDSASRPGGKEVGF